MEYSKYLEADLQCQTRPPSPHIRHSRPLPQTRLQMPPIVLESGDATIKYHPFYKLRQEPVLWDATVRQLVNI
jgi:hypothetical protein